MSSIPEFIRTEQNGIEYFTIVATGECAVSERGLALMSGVDRQTMRRWFSDLAHTGVPKWLEPLRTMPLDLAHEIQKNGKDIKPIPAKTAFKFVFLVAQNLKKIQAFNTIELIGEIGLTSYIQGVTGWLPIALQSSPESRTALDRILDDAKPYKVFFEPLLYEKAVKLMGVKFYWHYCYDFLTMTERCKLNQVRQKTPQGRIDYIHQHISPATIPKLERYLDRLAVLVKQAKNAQHFRTMYQKQFYDNQQMEIDFDAD